MRFEQTFMDFLLQHQERHNRTYHFLILMEGLINAAKRIQQYYLTGALKGNLGMAGDVNIQGEDVMRMDQIAQEVTIHYLQASGRVIHAVSEEAKRSFRSTRREAGTLFILTPWTVPQTLPTGFPSVSSLASPNGTSPDRKTAT
jgi:fructose-1,6-bisphosphatase